MRWRRRRPRNRRSSTATSSMTGWFAGLTLARKQAVWAWAFLAVPILFLRRSPLLAGARCVLAFADALEPRRPEAVRRPRQLRSAGARPRRSGRCSATPSSICCWACPSASRSPSSSPSGSTACGSGHGLLRALYFLPHLTTATAMAWVWRWFYQPPPVGVVQRLAVRVRARPTAVPALDRAGAPRGAGAGRSGRRSAFRSSSSSPA